MLVFNIVLINEIYNNNNLIKAEDCVNAVDNSLTYNENYGAYEIGDANDLIYLSQTSAIWNENFVQTSPITMEVTSWTPIGNSTTNFTGTYDGKGNMIEFLENVSTNSFWGTINNSKIKNLSIKWKNIVGNVEKFNSGIVAEANNSLISCCYVEGASKFVGLAGYTFGGGIVGGVSSGKTTIENCYNALNISIGAQYDLIYAGGILGSIYRDNAEVIIKNCYNTAKIYAEGGESFSAYAGGILGSVSSGKISIVNCFSLTGKENSPSVPNVDAGGVNLAKCGGIIAGDNSSKLTITKSYYDYPINNGGRGTQMATDSLTTLIKTKENYLNSSNWNISSDYKWDFKEIWAIDKSATNPINNGYPYLQVFYAPKTVAATISVTTNVGAILNIENESGESVQQIYVSPTTSQPIEMELDLTTYNIIISTYYTTNIITTTPNVTLIGNKLTFDTNNITEVSITLNGFVGNNGIII